MRKKLPTLSAMALLRRRALLAEGLAVPESLRPPVERKPIKGPAFRKRRNAKRDLPFMGVDGEGCGRDRRGRQHYRLLRAGEHELFRGGRPLRFHEIMDFICDLPADKQLVGFSIGYDVTQMLRSLPKDRLDRIFVERKTGEHLSYTHCDNYGIMYIPKNFLRVCRLTRARRRPDGTWQKAEKIEGTQRTIYEPFGFFGSSFLMALKTYGIGRQHWRTIRINKSQRSKVKSITRATRRYCALECELLTELMEKFRGLCTDAGIKPHKDFRWTGAGQLATALHKEHGTPTREQVEASTLPALRKLAKDGYCAGRFEIRGPGELAGPIHAYDQNSAFAAAMRDLPCLEHGKFVYTHNLTGFEGSNELFIAETHFTHPEGIPWCGLPIRTKSGGLVWPRQGSGVYWSDEIRSAQALGAVTSYPRGGWRYVKRCDCQTFDWIHRYYSLRQSLPALKQVLSSCYGKLAQKIPKTGGPWTNFIWAGLTTARVRAGINRAIAGNPEAILMIAADAIYSKQPLALDLGDGLGQWKAETLERLFIVMPGVYWSPGRVKGRGIPKAIFSRPVRARFERAWRRWQAKQAEWADLALPTVSVKIELFTGLRLAHHEGKPERAGRWEKTVRTYSFDWGRKRRKFPWRWEGNAVVTVPRDGGPYTRSVPHGENPAAEELEEGRACYDDQPDWRDKAPAT